MADKQNREEITSLLYEVLGEVLGAGMTDAATVSTVQQQLRALSMKTHNAVFDPQASSGFKDKYKEGVLGSSTKAAVSAFNTAYGNASDGPNITNATLGALYRVNNPTASVSQPAQKPPAAEAQAAANAVATAQVAAVAPPEVKAEAEEAQAAVAAAKTPAELKVAKAKVEAVAKSVQASAGMPLWGKILLGVGGLAVAGSATWLLLRKGSPKRVAV